MRVGRSNEHNTQMSWYLLLWNSHGKCIFLVCLHTRQVSGVHYSSCPSSIWRHEHMTIIRKMKYAVWWSSTNHKFTWNHSVECIDIHILFVLRGGVDVPRTCVTAVKRREANICVYVSMLATTKPFRSGWNRWSSACITQHYVCWSMFRFIPYLSLYCGLPNWFQLWTLYYDQWSIHVNST